MRWRLLLFGGVRVEVEDEGGALPVVLQPRPLALLAYLASDVPGRLHTRDSILAVLWPNRPERLARLALRQSLHQLVVRLGPDILARQGRVFVGLDPERLSCDVHRFEQALLDGRLGDALREYRGEFLEGFLLSSHPEPFEEWLLATRQRLRDGAVAAVTALSQKGSAASVANTHPALGWVHRALALSPYSEELLARAVDLRLEEGDRGGAMGEVRDFSKRLLKEVGLHPSARIRQIGERAAGEGDSGTPSPGPGLRLPVDGLRMELEAVLSGRASRAARRIEIVDRLGARHPAFAVVERDASADSPGAVVRIEFPSSRVDRWDGSLRSERDTERIERPEHDGAGTGAP